MPRRPTIFVKDCHYHVYNRGVAKQDIFLSDKDRRRFIEKIQKYSKEFDVKVLGYCLMLNHFHLLLKQEGDLPISEFMRHLLVAYSMFFNKKYSRVGPLFQNRFKAKLIEKDSYLLQLIRYIHQNPLEILPKTFSLSDYEWSSYSVYLGLRKESFVDTDFLLGYFSKKNPIKDFREFTEVALGENELKVVRPFSLETITPKTGS